MAWKIKGELQGLKEAAKALEGLKRGVRNKVLRRAVTAAARILAKAAKAAVTMRRSGQLKRSMGSVVRTYAKAVVGIVGPREDFKTTWNKQPVDPAKYAHLVEEGVRPHALGKGSSLKDKYSYDRKTRRRLLVNKANQHGRMHPGFEGRHFLKKAFDASQGAAAAKATELIADGIQQEAAKHAA